MPVSLCSIRWSLTPVVYSANGLEIFESNVGDLEKFNDQLSQLVENCQSKDQEFNYPRAKDLVSVVRKYRMNIKKITDM